MQIKDLVNPKNFSLLIEAYGNILFKSLYFNNLMLFMILSASLFSDFLNHPILKCDKRNILKLSGSIWKYGKRKCGSKGK
jgi:hypothetical protein